jgi:hypothetical protein
MQVNRINQETAEDLLNPKSQGWARADGIQVGLSPTPIGLQPSKGVRVAFENKKYGLIESATFQGSS